MGRWFSTSIAVSHRGGKTMVRALLRLILIVIVVIAVGAFFFGYRWADRGEPVLDRPIGTSGDRPIDTSRAREAGAEIGEKVAVGASAAERAVSDASLTTKIKSKMALDDTVDALAIDVDTKDGVVTLSGRVTNDNERLRALALARETDGVHGVVDRLVLTH
jgi:hyperosmotically inducible periplasmic protein